MSDDPNLRPPELLGRPTIERDGAEKKLDLSGVKLQHVAQDAPGARVCPETLPAPAGLHPSPAAPGTGVEPAGDEPVELFRVDAVPGAVFGRWQLRLNGATIGPEVSSEFVHELVAWFTAYLGAP